jgi:hypothetical protein
MSEFNPCKCEGNDAAHMMRQSLCSTTILRTDIETPKVEDHG